jgi:hypothetical protein
MDGHKRLARLLVESITGQAVSLADVPPPSPALVRTLTKVKQKQTIKVLAMSPVDKLMGPALAQLGADVQVDIVPWDVEDKSLAEIEAEAKSRVRAMKPDLIVIAVPRAAKAKSQEAFIHSYAWVMNWSLNYGPGGWDCLVVHASVVDPDRADASRDAITRQLVRAQDLHLVDRAADDSRSAQGIFTDWFKRQR